MAQVPTMTAPAAFSSASAIDIPKPRDVNANVTGAGIHSANLPTPPTSLSPDLPAHQAENLAHSPPVMDIAHEEDMHEVGTPEDSAVDVPHPSATPLSKGNLSGLDAAAAITPAMLAKHHLPRIMLGSGPRPIRYVIGELTQTVPGFSRIPPTKARRLVVAALESRHGGGVDGNVAFCKTGWGRWDAHVKGSSKDSGVGSFNDGHMSPPPSERSGHAYSNGDSGVHMRGMRKRDQHSGGSWTASDIREEDEFEMDMDMDMPENEADKMSLDSMDEDNSSTDDDETDDDGGALGAAALRKASLPTPGAPRLDYNKIAAQARPPRSWLRRTSGQAQQAIRFSSSLPQSIPPQQRRMSRGLSHASATPEEQAAVAALLSLSGSM